MIVMAVLLLRGTGIICGRIAGSFFGLYDTRLVSEASWVGIPEGGYEGINLNFGTDFQVLLPVLVLVMVVSSIKTVGRSLPFSVCHGATHVPQISESPRLRWWQTVSGTSCRVSHVLCRICPCPPQHQ